MLTKLHSDDSVITKTTPEPDVGSTTSIRDTDIKLLSRTVTRCSVTYRGAEPRYTNQVSDIQDPISYRRASDKYKSSATACKLRENIRKVQSTIRTKHTASSCMSSGKCHY